MYDVFQVISSSLVMFLCLNSLFNKLSRMSSICISAPFHPLLSLSPVTCVHTFSLIQYWLMYQILFFSSCLNRFEILPPEVRKREKSPKFLSGLKSRKEKRHIEPESSERHLKLLDTIRVQMQVCYSVCITDVGLFMLGPFFLFFSRSLLV